MKIEIESDELRDLQVFAFRYALGRLTSAPYTVDYLIRNNASALSKADKKQMIGDINGMIERNEKFYTELWSEFAEWLKVDK